MIQTNQIFETLRMIDQEKLDVRTITMGISLFNCVCDDTNRLASRVYNRIARQAENLVKVGEEIQREIGVPIVNKRISVTPVSLITGAVEDPLPVARALDKAAKETGVDFIGVTYGYGIRQAMIDAGAARFADKPLDLLPLILNPQS